MKIDLENNTIEVKVHFKDKENIKKLGFMWDKRRKVWGRGNANDLNALQLAYIKELEIRYYAITEEEQEDELDLWCAYAEIQDAGDR